MSYAPIKKEFWIFKKCENGGCGRWGFKWTVKRKPMWINKINDYIGINTGPKICGRCRRLIDNAVNERNK